MIEVDYLWVGEKTKTGDAITCRFTNPATGLPVVVVIDGGFQDDGKRIADHIKTYYGTPIVDLVICTHPDDDHIQGLFGLFDELTVSRLLIHRPSAYGYKGDDVKASTVEDLITVAKKGKAEAIHDFAGTTYFGGALTIAGPNESYYKDLLAEQVSASQSGSSLTAASTQSAYTLMSDPGETLDTDNGGTTARNNSSIITNIVVDGYRLLFTGDAGAPALERAADLLDSLGKSSIIDLFDVPHHGSRHNLDRQLVERLLGPTTSIKRGEALVSVGKEADNFPRAEVANALKRRGYPWFATRGKNMWWHRGAEARPGYQPMVEPSWLDE